MLQAVRTARTTAASSLTSKGNGTHGHFSQDLPLMSVAIYRKPSASRVPE